MHSFQNFIVRLIPNHPLPLETRIWKLVVRALDEISILENFWMFVRSVAQCFVRIVAQYQYQAIVIYTRFSTEIDISLFAIYRSLRTVHHIFACLWKF